ncbi:MAG TPA: hypothetical protein VFT45_21750 [Longimicrobium sp.]|nr:hypothetical protein [Longimicrobium sp.]
MATNESELERLARDAEAAEAAREAAERVVAARTELLRHARRYREAIERARGRTERMAALRAANPAYARGGIPALIRAGLVSVGRIMVVLPLDVILLAAGIAFLISLYHNFGMEEPPLWMKATVAGAIVLLELILNHHLSADAQRPGRHPSVTGPLVLGALLCVAVPLFAFAAVYTQLLADGHRLDVADVALLSGVIALAGVVHASTIFDRGAFFDGLGRLGYTLSLGLLARGRRSDLASARRERDRAGSAASEYQSQIAAYRATVATAEIPPEILIAEYDAPLINDAVGAEVVATAPPPAAGARPAAATPPGNADAAPTVAPAAEPGTASEADLGDYYRRLLEGQIRDQDAELNPEPGG